MSIESPKTTQLKLSFRGHLFVEGLDQSLEVWAIESKRFGENENEDHTHVDVFLRVCTHACVTHNANAQACSQGRQTAAKTSSQVSVTEVVRVIVVQSIRSVGDFSLVDHSDNQSVNTQDTCHDSRNQRLESELGMKHTNRTDSDSGSCSSICGTKVSENQGSSKATKSEESV